jgi:hypothetical protein
LLACLEMSVIFCISKESQSFCRSPLIVSSDLFLLSSRVEDSLQTLPCTWIIETFSILKTLLSTSISSFLDSFKLKSGSRIDLTLRNLRSLKYFYLVTGLLCRIRSVFLALLYYRNPPLLDQSLYTPSQRCHKEKQLYACCYQPNNSVCCPLIREVGLAKFLNNQIS